MITNAPDVDALTGRAYQVGGSASAGAAIGVEVITMNDSETGEMYTGLSFSFGPGALWAEVHGEVGYTWDVFDLIKSVIFY